MSKAERKQNQNIPDQQIEIDRVRTYTLTAFTNSVLSSIGSGFYGINANPVLALREVLLFSQDIDALSHQLGFHIEDQGVEDAPKECNTAKKFLINGVIDTIRAISSKAADNQKLNSEELSILKNLMIAKTRDGENCNAKTIQAALEKHFIASCNPDKTDDSNLDDDSGKKRNKKQTSKEAKARDPKIIKEILMAKKFENAAIWRLSENSGLSYLAVSEILEKWTLDKNNQVIRKTS